MLHISPSTCKLFQKVMYALSRAVCLLRSIFKVVQGHATPCAPANTRSVSDSRLSCVKLMWWTDIDSRYNKTPDCDGHTDIQRDSIALCDKTVYANYDKFIW